MKHLISSRSFRPRRSPFATCSISPRNSGFAPSSSLDSCQIRTMKEWLFSSNDFIFDIGVCTSDPAFREHADISQVIKSLSRFYEIPPRRDYAALKKIPAILSSYRQWRNCCHQDDGSIQACWSHICVTPASPNSHQALFFRKNVTKQDSGAIFQEAERNRHTTVLGWVENYGLH